MPITEATRPYETLIRHNPDGTIGSHHVTITEVLRDGTVIAATANMPVSIVGADLVGVLGQATVAALAQLETLKANLAAQADANAALTQQHDELRAQAQTVATNNAELRYQVNTARAITDAMLADKEAMGAAHDALALQVHGLQAQLDATSAERSALALQVPELQAELAQYADLRAQAQAVAYNNAELRHQADTASASIQALLTEKKAIAAAHDALAQQVLELQAQLAQRDAA